MYNPPVLPRIFRGQVTAYICIEVLDIEVLVLQPLDDILGKASLVHPTVYVLLLSPSSIHASQGLVIGHTTTLVICTPSHMSSAICSCHLSRCRSPRDKYLS